MNGTSVSTPGLQVNWWDELQQSIRNTTHKLKETTIKVCVVVDKIKNSPAALAKVTGIVRYTFADLKKLSRGLGHAEAVIDLFQFGGTIHFLANAKSLFDRKNLEDISFGVANAANAILWFQSHNHEFLGAAAVTIGNVLNSALIVGYSGVAYSAYNSLHGAKSKDEVNYNLCKLVWAVSEVALVALPAMSLVSPPAWSVIVIVKILGLTTFLLEPAKNMQTKKEV